MQSRATFTAARTGAVRTPADTEFSPASASVSAVLDEIPLYDDERRRNRGFDSANFSPAAILAPETQQNLIVSADDAAFQEFRHQVNTWMEVDGSIRNLQAMLRERRLYKQALTTKITQFMRRYDLTNLDMGESGTIRSRRSQVRTPISHKEIRDAIAAYFEARDNATLGVQLTDTVFNNNRERVERVSLQRRFPQARNTQGGSE